MRILLLALTAALLGAASPVAAQHRHAAVPPCATAELACATAATPAFAPDGSLWLAWSAGGKVMVAHSADLGHSFTPAVAITPNPARIDTGPDARPKLAIDGAGRIHAAYAVFQDDRYNGRVYVTHSLDGGASFAAPQPITADATSQRFEALAIDPAGDLFAAWIDKRNAAVARSEGKPYPGAALAIAWSKDAGGSFTPARIAVDQTCECCRLGVAFAAPHQPVVAFRDIFDGTTRDHAVVTFAGDAPGPVHRVSSDDWNIDVCPHQGPSLAIADGAYHIVWFTDGQARHGVFYARSLDGGARFSAPMAIGGQRAERPAVLARGRQVWLAWKEFDGEATTVKLIASADAGASWSGPETLASTGDACDHPLLISDDRHVFLSWLTKAEGYRLLPLPGP